MLDFIYVTENHKKELRIHSIQTFKETFSSQNRTKNMHHYLEEYMGYEKLKIE